MLTTAAAIVEGWCTDHPRSSCNRVVLLSWIFWAASTAMTATGITLAITTLTHHHRTGHPSQSPNPYAIAALPIGFASIVACLFTGLTLITS